jgi:ATP-dependent Lon protease
MATAIVSLLTGIPIRADVAMTGEITLRGRVLPVGGVREKALAALRRGIKRIIIPHSNEHDLEEIPGDLARQIEFHLVRNMDEVLELALRDPVLPLSRPRSSARRPRGSVAES